ncbi:MAG: hypothetical protein LBO09_09385 [Candidatus Peribacteria bacterium]|jgi:hypothetical protein|nr:hypothetical protein [Candidatus Peribacteria bacterium]
MKTKEIKTFTELEQHPLFSSNTLKVIDTANLPIVKKNQQWGPLWDKRTEYGKAKFFYASMSVWFIKYSNGYLGAELLIQEKIPSDLQESSPFYPLYQTFIKKMKKFVRDVNKKFPYWRGKYSESYGASPFIRVYSERLENTSWNEALTIADIWVKSIKPFMEKIAEIKK